MNKGVLSHLYLSGLSSVVFVPQVMESTSLHLAERRGELIKMLN